MFLSVFGHGIIFYKLLINTKIMPGLIGLFGFLLFAISIFTFL